MRNADEPDFEPVDVNLGGGYQIFMLLELPFMHVNSAAFSKKI